MKSPFLRPALALALALGLAACGGKATFVVGGTVSGLLYPGLILVNGGSELAVPAGATTFAFPNQIDYGATYAVEIKANTQPLHQTCSVLNGSDSAGRMASINIVVQCGLNAYSIGGSVAGLTTDGLVLTNGTSGGTVTIAKGATSYAFGTPVTYGNSYGVTVLTQPTGQTCTVANATGEMQDAAVTNINITCTTTIQG
jgi:hypothetical protein